MSGPYFGKYRGTVTDNQDPRKQGRLRATVPEILGTTESGWALPCAPYTGSYAVPAAGAGVWLEFEAGDVSRPIWVGCWWPGGKAPLDETGAEATPDAKLLRSEEGLVLALHDDSRTIALGDADGKNVVTIEVDGGTVTIRGGSKVVVDAPAVELGGDGQKAVLGDKLSSFLNNVVSMVNSHMHPGQSSPTGPVTPAPPAPQLSPPTPDLLSTTVKLG